MADRAHLARVEELLRAYDLWDDTDTLKHALEDWQRWGAGIKSGVQPAVIERLVDKLVEAMLPLALPLPSQEPLGRSRRAITSSGSRTSHRVVSHRGHARGRSRDHGSRRLVARRAEQSVES